MEESKYIFKKKTFYIYCRQKIQNECKLISHILKKEKWDIDLNNPEVVIIIGGDGSFIEATQMFLKKNKKPFFLFLNAGFLGFFSMDNISNLKISLDYLIHNRLENYKLDTLLVQINKKYYYALNELKIISLMKTNTWIVSIFHSSNCIFNEQLTATGIVFSTTLGSNGLARSLGSSIISPSLKVIQYTKIAPVHNKISTSILGSLIIEKQSKIIVKNLRPSKVYSYIDNNLSIGKNINQHIIKLKENHVNLLIYKDNNFFFKKMKKLYNF